MMMIRAMRILAFGALVLALAMTSAPAQAAASEEPGATAPAEFREEFLKLCDLALEDINAETRQVPFYNDSYAVRALCVAYDMTGREEYLDKCRQWSERMIGYQEQMNPAGAYYMNYNRKPGESTGAWYVADSSSIALGILATAVRCKDPVEKARFQGSAEKFARLVLENYVGEEGGIRNGLWPRFDGEWWCSSGIFGSLLFMLHGETGEPQYLERGRGVIGWLNKLEIETAGPLTLKEMGVTMPMYVLEAYSTAWPKLEPGSELFQGALAQVESNMSWIEEKSVLGEGGGVHAQGEEAAPRASGLHSQWGSKTGGLPFHMYIYGRRTEGREGLVAQGDEIMRHVIHRLRTEPQEGLSQLAAFGMFSLAERLSPGGIYRTTRHND